MLLKSYQVWIKNKKIFLEERFIFSLVCTPENSSLSTMILSKRSVDKELFSGEQSSKENTLRFDKFIVILFDYKLFIK